jgi:hypothetical protein
MQQESERKPLTFAQNAMMTIKVLLAAGAIIAGIWAIEAFVG